MCSILSYHIKKWTRHHKVTQTWLNSFLWDLQWFYEGLLLDQDDKNILRVISYVSYTINSSTLFWTQWGLDQQWPHFWVRVCLIQTHQVIDSFSIYGEMYILQITRVMKYTWVLWPIGAGNTCECWGTFASLCWHLYFTILRCTSQHSGVLHSSVKHGIFTPTTCAWWILMPQRYFSASLLVSLSSSWMTCVWVGEFPTSEQKGFLVSQTCFCRSWRRKLLPSGEAVGGFLKGSNLKPNECKMWIFVSAGWSQALISLVEGSLVPWTPHSLLAGIRTTITVKISWVSLLSSNILSTRCTLSKLHFGNCVHTN